MNSCWFYVLIICGVLYHYEYFGVTYVASWFVFTQALVFVVNIQKCQNKQIVDKSGYLWCLHLFIWNSSVKKHGIKIRNRGIGSDQEKHS